MAEERTTPNGRLDGQFPEVGITRQHFLRRSLGAAVSLGSLGVLLEGCGSSGSSAAKTASTSPPAQASGTLTQVFSVAGPASLDPARAIGAGDFEFVNNVYDTLVRFTEDGTALEPGLATSFTLSPDAREFVAKLRPGVTFHDGTSFDSTAVRKTLEHYASSPGLGQILLPKFTHIDDSNPAVIRLVAGDPAPDLARNLTFIWIISPHLLSQGAEAATKASSGTGPFSLVSHGTSAISLKRNPHYWEKGPYVENVEMKVITDVGAKVAALETGQADIVAELPPAQLAGLRNNSRVKLVTGEEWAVSYLSCVLLPGHPTADLNVRKAIAHSINRASIAKSVLRGQWPVAQGFQPKTTYGYSPMEPQYPFDVAEAKSLLQQAGGGKTINLRVAAVSGADDQLNQAIVAQLQEAGFNASLNVLEEGVFNSEVGAPNPKHDVYSTAHTWANGGPLIYALKFFENFSYFASGEPKATSEASAALAARIASTPDGPARLKLIGQIQKVFAEQLPYIPTWDRNATDGLAKRVQGYSTTPARLGLNLRKTYLTAA